MSDPHASPIMVPPTLVRPTWADPRYCLATNAWRGTLVAVASATPISVAPNNPLRWGLGFSNPQMSATVLTLSPAPNPTVNPFYALQSNSFVWYDLLSYGPLVCTQWFASGGIGGQVMVWEVFIA